MVKFERQCLRVHYLELRPRAPYTYMDYFIVCVCIIQIDAALSCVQQCEVGQCAHSVRARAISVCFCVFFCVCAFVIASGPGP